MSYAEKIEALVAERDALRKDAERLSFLQANPRAVSRAYGYFGSADCWATRRKNDEAPQDFESLRGAIDAAMATTPAVGDA